MNLARLSLFAVLAPMLAIAACQQEKQAPAETGPGAKPGLEASDGTLLLPAVKGNPGAAYFTLVNNGDKPAVLAAIAIDGAGKVEMHETMGGTMAPVASLEVKPGETVKFERGRRHVMAFDLAPTIAAGSSVEMTLTFADGDKLSTPLKVETMGGGGGEMNQGDMDHGEMDHGEMDHGEMDHGEMDHGEMDHGDMH